MHTGKNRPKGSLKNKKTKTNERGEAETPADPRRRWETRWCIVRKTRMNDQMKQFHPLAKIDVDVFVTLL